ncbi:MAG: hypothetical protein FH757_04430 [Alcanivorax sp.]|nr:hypothetical protein [Alcanivorax sp.]
MSWYEIIPSLMSSIASMAAAVAAFGSLRVSREAKSVAERSTLAAHHDSASVELSMAMRKVEESTRGFSDFAYRMWSEWASEIEEEDQRRMGGDDPRPLRHVLTNASEMLFFHGTRGGRSFKRARSSMFLIVRNGMVDLSDDEYKALLKKADGEYLGFESTLGAPAFDRPITYSPAFRWAYYQLTRRVDDRSWSSVWEKAWAEGGWLSRYRDEFFKIKQDLRSVVESLENEKEKLRNSVFPLESNPALFYKYNIFLEAMEAVLKDCDLKSFEIYQNCRYSEDLPLLVLYSMSIAFLSAKALEVCY